MAEQIFSDRPAAMLLTDKIANRHFDVLEEHLVDVMAAVERRNRPHGNAGRIHVDKQERNAFLRTAVAVRAHETEDPVGPLCKRRPDLLAVDDIERIAVPRDALGACLQRSQIGTGAGLRIALTPPVLHRHDARQKIVTLRRCAEFLQHRPDHRQTERHLARRTRGEAFLIEDIALRSVPPCPAVFDWPCRRTPAIGREDALPAHVIFARQMAEIQHAIADIRGQPGSHEFLHRCAKGLVFETFSQFHTYTPLTLRLRRTNTGSRVQPISTMPLFNTTTSRASTRARKYKRVPVSRQNWKRITSPG